MSIILYGISNCDQVKKARAWFDERAIPIEFHDFRKLGLDETLLDNWLSHLPWDALLNKRGTTWRQLDSAVQHSLTDAQSAKQAFLAHPTLIKRPVVQTEDDLLIGFNPLILEQRFGK
jgi:arsenate reductase (glutaredoxin)